MKDSFDTTNLTTIFLHQQLWNSAIRASLSRAESVYKEGVSKKAKDEFKQELFKFTNELIDQFYSNSTPTEESHLERIKGIIAYTEGFEKILSGEKLNFGRAQKVLNLYLKYRWCLGTASIPPHFPVDRIIQLKLGLPNPPPWTSWKDESEYENVIKLAKIKAEEKGFESIAEFELWLYNSP